MAIGDETVTPGELPAIVEESRWSGDYYQAGRYRDIYRFF